MTDIEASVNATRAAYANVTRALVALESGYTPDRQHAFDTAAATFHAASDAEWEARRTAHLRTLVTV